MPYLAAKYPDEVKSRHVYLQVQEIVLNSDVDTTSYRVECEGMFIVVFMWLADLPSDTIIDVWRLLEGGERIELPNWIEQELLDRHVEAYEFGEQWKMSYRPGLVIPLIMSDQEDKAHDN